MRFLPTSEGIRGTREGERGLREIRNAGSFWEQLHHVYIAIALLGTAASFFADKPFTERLLLGFIAGYIVVIAAFAAWSTFVNGAKARYAPLMTHFHSAQHTLRDLRLLMRTDTFRSSPRHKELVVGELRQVLDSLRSCLEIVSGTTVECRIELVYRPVASVNGDDFRTYPLVRDSVSAQRRSHMDLNACEVPHALAKSSPYMQLLHGDGSTSYFCGDIQGQQDFRCEYFVRFPESLRPRSTIVWPIRYKRRADLSAEGGAGAVEIVGFLHAESVSKEAFTRRYDLELGAMYADALFDVVFDHVNLRRDVVHAILPT